MRKSFFELVFICRYHHLLGKVNYWSTANDMATLKFTTVMSRKRICAIKQYFCIANNYNFASSTVPKILPLLCVKVPKLLPAQLCLTYFES